MPTVKMRFQDGETRDVEEADLIPALAKGAVQVNRYALDPSIENPPEPIVKEAKVGK